MKRTEVLVIGAGPSGIAAATAAAEMGKEVILLDDNRAPGGQIWRGESTAADVGRANKGRGSSEGRSKGHAIRRLMCSGANICSGYRVFDIAGTNIVRALCEDSGGAETVSFQFDQLVLATGARERFLPFPGWTLPGVLGAGGLQALVKGGFPIAGERVVVAGTGPLLLAVGAHLVQYDARVVSVNEQASMAQMLPFAASLALQPGKVWQGLRYRAALRGTPYRTHCWPVAAVADKQGKGVSAVRLTDGSRTWEEPCDLLACGFHLVGNTELAELLGCSIRDGCVQVDKEQRTSVANIFCAGEPTGIAGLEAARLQGRIAGLACAGRKSLWLQKRAAVERGFGAGLEKAFVLRMELKLLAEPQTIVCRCEDVTLAQLAERTGWTDAKLQTRCGMGPCQGRICGPAVETLLGWRPCSVRPPIFPVPLGALCTVDEAEQIVEGT
jgi:NADPH-dependent 2,4-dienoyl-CoA reductase/sulfur reductase-like enzyme